MTVDDRLAASINAMSPDLSAFRAAGGKLIQYHGLADPVVLPRESIDYYERVQATEDVGKPPRADAIADFDRHCRCPRDSARASPLDPKSKEIKP
jgi:hypothetical protein